MKTLNSIGYTTVVVSILFPVLATLSVIARFYTRGKLNNGRGIDDWLILIGLIFYYAFAADVMIGIFVYAGVEEFPNATVQMESLIIYQKTLYFLSPAYAVPISLVKFSILAFYRRLFTVGKFPRISAIVGIICVMWSIVGLVGGLLYCIPMHKFWDPTVPGHCYDYPSFFLAMELLNVSLDVTILALPIKMILGLHLPTKKKVVIGCIFLLGGFVIVTAIIRIALVYQPHNPYVSFTAGALWTSVQLGVAIVCACLPTYAPLWPPIKNFANSIRNVYESFLKTSTKSRETTKATDSGNGIPGTNSYYKRMDNSNGDQIHLTEITSPGLGYDSQRKRDESLRGIRVKRDVYVV